MTWTTALDQVLLHIDAWVVALFFFAAMILTWRVGCRSGAKASDRSDDPSMKFTDASLAILGLLLAFTFAMSLGRHDQRRLTLVNESNALGDFYTCASLLKDPHRTALQNGIRGYTEEQLRMLSRYISMGEQLPFEQRNREACNRMTEMVAAAVADGTPIAVPLTNTLNEVTSATASRLAAYDEVLPWSITVLLLLSAVVPSFLMGRLQAISGKPRISGVLFFVVLVTLVIFVTMDLSQPRRGLIRVNREPFERVLLSMK